MNKKCSRCLEGFSWERFQHLGFILATISAGLSIVWLIKKIKEPPLEIPAPLILNSVERKEGEAKQ
ncbi:MAG: hypothetical protein WC394_02870 [Candidatus Omnitrophota bacterium]|jgi:hypothetical protein